MRTKKTMTGTTTGLYMTDALRRDLQAYRERNGQQASIGQWVAGRVTQAQRVTALERENQQLKAQIRRPPTVATTPTGTPYRRPDARKAEAEQDFSITELLRRLTVQLRLGLEAQELDRDSILGIAYAEMVRLGDKWEVEIEQDIAEEARKLARQWLQ